MCQLENGLKRRGRGEIRPHKRGIEVLKSMIDEGGQG
jgi:hypothetical protein